MNTSVFPEATGSRRSPTAIIVALGALVTVALIAALTIGIVPLTPWVVLGTLAGQGTPAQEFVIIDLRLPRALIATLVGAGFAVAGAILQGVTRNPLADPGILGISAGAGAGLIALILCSPRFSNTPIEWAPVTAAVGGLSTAALIYVLAWKRGVEPVRLLLVGVAVGALITAVTSAASLRVNPWMFNFLVRWFSGWIWGTSWSFVLAVAPWVLLLIMLAWARARTLDLLNLNDEVATGIGLRVERSRLLFLAIAACLTAACVAVGGCMPFVGLLGPHLARLLTGPHHAVLLPGAALAGAALVLVSDVIARRVVAPVELPTGVVVAVIGAPYFLFLLARGAWR